MTDYGYDAAYFQRTEILQSGCVVVFVYTDGTHAYSAADVASIHVAKPIIFNHENAQTELAAGYAAGALAAKHALAAVVAYGAPADGSVAIFFSVDSNVAINGFGPYRSAFDGINDYLAGRYKTGVYGEGALIDDLAASGRIQVKGWLSASSSYPSHNVNDAHVGAYQQVGSDIPSTDRDVITDLPGLAPWWPVGVSPSGGGTPIGEDVNLSDPVPVWGSATATQTVSFALAKAAGATDILNDETSTLAQIAATLTSFQGETVDETKLAADLASSLQTELPASFIAALAAKLGGTA